MKYIKEYSNTYYYETSSQEFENLVYPNKSIDFIQTEIDEIIKIYQPITINKDQFGVRGHISIFAPNTKIKGGGTDIEIFKIPDEWYMVQSINDIRLHSILCYYKCDQLEGLLYLLEELIYNK